MRPTTVTVAGQDLFGKPAPRSLESEMALLGSMILDPRVIPEVTATVRAQDFFDASHGIVFAAIAEIADANEKGEIDLVMLHARLQRDGVAKEITAAHLQQLAEGVPVATNAVFYARTIAQLAKERRLVDWASQAIYEVYHAAEKDRAGIFDRAEQALYGLAHASEATEAEPLAAILDREMRRLDQQEGQAAGVTTGFYELDQILSGLHAGEMIVLAARPSMGKTALGTDFARHAALAGTPTGLFSLEMSKASISQRLLSAQSGVRGTDIRTGAMGDESYRRVFDAYKELASAPIHIDDSAALSVMQVRARARRLAAKHKIGLLVIDYLQLMTSGASSRETRQVEVSEISRGIKALARDLNIPVVCLSQLNRASEQREGNRPRMSDLRESGSIEQDADVVMLLHREDYYHAGEPAWDPASHQFNHENADKIGVAEVIVAKQRNGPTGSVKLVWESECTRFQNCAGVVLTGESRRGGGA